MAANLIAPEGRDIFGASPRYESLVYIEYTALSCLALRQKCLRHNDGHSVNRP